MELISCEEWTFHGVNLWPMGNGASFPSQKNFPKMQLLMWSLRSGSVGQSQDSLLILSVARPVMPTLVLGLPPSLPHFLFPSLLFLRDCNPEGYIWIQGFHTHTRYLKISLISNHPLKISALAPDLPPKLKMCYNQVVLSAFTRFTYSKQLRGRSRNQWYLFGSRPQKRPLCQHSSRQPG